MSASSWMNKLGWLAVLLVWLSACRAAAQPLEFQFLHEFYTFPITDAATYTALPELWVIASADEIVLPAKGVLLPEALRDDLEKIDYSQSFVVFAGRGRIGGSNIVYGVDRKGSRVYLNASAYSPGPGEYVEPDETRPFEIIQVSKGGSWQRDVRLVVLSDNLGETAEIEHYIP